MDLEELFAPNILIVSGKGGVGKTTVAGALGILASRSGRTSCIVTVDGTGAMSRLFESAELDYTATEMAPKLWGMNVVPEGALAEYLNVQYRMRRISRIFSSTHFVDYVTAAAPGLKDILMLGKIWYLEQGRSGGDPSDFDTIIVDAPAAGHMLTFLSAPAGLSDAVRVGPIRRQADWLVSMLRDPARCRVHLVALPEEMPVSETIETSAALGSKLGISQGVVFANAVYAAMLEDEEKAWLHSRDVTGLLVEEAGRAGLSLDEDDVASLLDYARFREARRDIQQRHLAHLRANVVPDVVELPLMFAPALALPDIELLADAIEDQVTTL